MSNQIVFTSNWKAGSFSDYDETGSNICDTCVTTNSASFWTYINGEMDTTDNPTGEDYRLFDSAEFNAVQMADMDDKSRGS